MLNSLSRIKCALVVAAIFLGLPPTGADVAWAYDILNLQHTPPTLDIRDEMHEGVNVSIPAAGIKRARVLVRAEDGYRSVPMIMQNDKFVANLKFGTLASLHYRFQVEGEDSTLNQSSRYVIRQPSSQALEGRISTLQKEADTVSAKVEQSQAALRNLQAVTPESLSRQRNKEYAQAILLLTKRERELAQLRQKSERGQ